MATKTKKPNPEAYAKRIQEALTMGFQAAAVEYKDYVDRGGDTRALRACAPQIPSVTWDSIAALAAGTISPRVLNQSDRIAVSLRGLPIAEQDDIMDNGVDVLLDSGEVVRRKIDELSGRLRRLIFTKRGVRTPAQQRTAMEGRRLGRRPERQPLVVDTDISVSPDSKKHVLRIEVAGVCRVLTRKELLNLLAEME